MQVAQEVSQRRTQRAGRFRGIAPALAPGPEPGQIPSLRLVEGFPADLVEVGQELVRRALLRRDAGIRVAPPPARREVSVPGRAETRRAALDQLRCGLAHPGQTPIQAFHQKDQRPTRELGTSGTRRLAQPREPEPGPLGDKIEALRLGREYLPAGLEEPGERVELRFVALDRCPRPARRHQRDDHPPRRFADLCCLHENRPPDRGEQTRRFFAALQGASGVLPRGPQTPTGSNART
jgi:hypothetical protein